MSTKHIVFVCTGNSCRSVMAHRLLQDSLQRAGVQDVTVASAGVFAIEGMGATRETQRVLQQVGIECTDHAARVVTPAIIQDADLILVMEQFHITEVLTRAPGAKSKVQLLKTYGVAPGTSSDNPNIPDPIGKPLEVYEVCFAEIREAVERVARSLGVPSI